MGTLVGSTPNAIMGARLGLRFDAWAVYGLPVTAAMLAAMGVTFWLHFRPGDGQGRAVVAAPPRLSGKGRLTLRVFVLTALCWGLEAPLGRTLGVEKDFAAVVALTSMGALALLGLVDWADVLRGVDWGSLLLFGGGLCLGLSLERTGAARFLAENLAAAAHTMPKFAFVFLLTLVVIFATELISNTATAALFTEILWPLSEIIGLLPAVLLMPVAFAASCAFMFPVATPPNAMAYGTGLVRRQDMLKLGLILNIVGAAVIAGITWAVG